MNGKDIILGLNYISTDLIGEAEFGVFSEAKQPGHVKVRRPLLIAAMVALMLLLMGCTVAAVAYVQGWFPGFFAGRSDAPLSDSQISFIAENEQVINESQMQNDWTVELKSAINDGNTAYIILAVRAPVGVTAGNVEVNGTVKTWMFPGNGGLKGAGDVITCSEGISSVKDNYWYQIGYSWADDGDGLANTHDMVFQLTFNRFDASKETSITEPFGPAMDFYIHIENIVLEYEDEAYLQELLNGKYKGQTDVMFTPEETDKLTCVDILAEGTWDFTVNFAESQTGVELLSEPVATTASVIKNTGPGIEDYVHATEEVPITSFVLKSLSATVCYQYNGGVNFPDVFAVMKDGSRIALSDHGAGGVGYCVLEAESPIVPEDVDHILMGDGTKLPMPEIPEE